MRSFILPGCVALVGCLVVGACSSDSPQQGGFVNQTGGSSGSGSGGTSGAAGSGGGGGGAAGTGGAAGATGGSAGATSAGAGGTGGGGTGGAAGGGAPGAPDASATTPEAGGGGSAVVANDAATVVRDATSSTVGDGAAGGLPAPVPSPGCGKMAPAADLAATMATSGYSGHPLTVTGARADAGASAINREYFVRLPANYDPAKPYRTVYLAPGCSPPQMANAMARTVYQLETQSKDQAILVAMVQGTYNKNQYMSATDYCFDDMDRDSVEYPYFDALHKAVEAAYCVDTGRQFYGGYSSGGWMGHMLGCAFPDVLRAQATVTGELPPSISETNRPTAAQKACVAHPIAAMFIHDEQDVSNAYAGSVRAAHRLFINNGCTGTFADPTRAADRAATPPRLVAGQTAYTAVNRSTSIAIPSTATWGCVQYGTCPTAYPITFCGSNGQGHGDQATNAVPAMWDYFSKF